RRRWLFMPLVRRILPVPVILKRRAAPLCVLSLGIRPSPPVISRWSSVWRDQPCWRHVPDGCSLAYSGSGSGISRSSAGVVAAGTGRELLPPLGAGAFL